MPATLARRGAVPTGPRRRLYGHNRAVDDWAGHRFLISTARSAAFTPVRCKLLKTMVSLALTVLANGNRAARTGTGRKDLVPAGSAARQSGRSDR